MSNILKVLQEVKLREHKIDLGIVDDIAKMSKQIKSISDELSAILKVSNEAKDELKAATKKADKADKNGNAIVKKADKIEDRVVNILGKARNAAKDLGISPKSIKGYNKLTSELNIMDNLFTKVNKFKWD